MFTSGGGGIHHLGFPKRSLLGGNLPISSSYRETNLWTKKRVHETGEVSESCWWVCCSQRNLAASKVSWPLRDGQPFHSPLDVFSPLRNTSQGLKNKPGYYTNPYFCGGYVRGGVEWMFEKIRVSAYFCQWNLAWYPAMKRCWTNQGQTNSPTNNPISSITRYRQNLLYLYIMLHYHENKLNVDIHENNIYTGWYSEWNCLIFQFLSPSCHPFNLHVYICIDERLYMELEPL